jgi:hypothetical protein
MFLDNLDADDMKFESPEAKAEFIARREWQAMLDAMPLDTVAQMSERLARSGSEYRPGLMATWFREGRLTGKDAAALLRDEWATTDYIRPHRDDLLAMFEAAVAATGGPITDAPRRVNIKPRVLTVYRGTNIYEFDEPVERIGISWTTNRKVAAYFLTDRMHRGEDEEDKCILRGRIASEHVLGYFFKRKESEIVLDPRRLVDLRLIETPS